MLHSMTAFARREAPVEPGTATWELRSVNHRYLDVTLRLPEELRALEPAARERVAARLRRGKVDCSLRYQPAGDESTAFHINAELARRIADACRQVGDLLDPPAPVSPLDVLRWPGVIEAPPLDAEKRARAVLALLEQTLEELVATRAREGAKLEAAVRERLGGMRELVAAVRARRPQAVEAARERLLARLAELREEVDASRIEQEVALLAQKMDVAEELDRLDAHIAEMERALGGEEAVGRRLEFLTQEMNREANTLGAKSADAETGRHSVDLKVYIDQIREQIQNVE